MQQLYRSGDLGQASQSGHAPMAQPGSGARRSDQPCVLVVDDDGGVRMVSARALEGAGFAVLAAADGIEALELLEGVDVRIDLVLTDISMPRLDGIALGRQIAARQWPIPVLYMSADPSEVVGGSAGAAKKCLLKPFSMTALVTMVGQLLAL